jgi:tRNA wybutosine-synthesizing protein 2
MLKPYEKVVKVVKNTNLIASEKIELLPKKWERLGDILMVRIPPLLAEDFERVAPIYAKVLKCKSVLEDVGGVKGEERKPIVRLVWGEKNTETIHLENGIRYKFDPLKIMFSSGNLSERTRMAKIDCKDEVIVDGFAGIGYFTLPLAKYGKSSLIYACELNSLTFSYLEENIKLNGVEHIVKPLLGDYKEVSPEGCADRVILGYLKSTSDFLEKTMRVLKEKGGIIYYHETCPKEEFPKRPFRKIKTVAHKFNFKAELLKSTKVKSYAPCIFHIVLDVRVYR